MNNNKSPLSKLILEADNQILEATYTGKRDRLERPIYELFEVTGTIRHNLGLYVVYQHADNRVVYWRLIVNPLPRELAPEEPIPSIAP